MKNNESLYAINTRISTEMANRMNELLSITKKTTSSFVCDAINEYLSQIYEKKYEPSKALQIDKFAAEIERKQK